jgi:hypothetical protein
MTSGAPPTSSKDKLRTSKDRHNSVSGSNSNKLTRNVGPRTSKGRPNRPNRRSARRCSVKRKPTDASLISSVRRTYSVATPISKGKLNSPSRRSAQRNSANTTNSARISGPCLTSSSDRRGTPRIGSARLN